MILEFLWIPPMVPAVVQVERFNWDTYADDRAFGIDCMISDAYDGEIGW